MGRRELDATNAGWTPSRRSKYYNCLRWKETRESCTLSRVLCDTCPFYDPPLEALGRPNFTGVNWADEIDRDRYVQEKYAHERRRRLLKYFECEVVRAAHDRAVPRYRCSHCMRWHYSTALVIKFEWQGCRSCRCRERTRQRETGKAGYA